MRSRHISRSEGLTWPWKRSLWSSASLVISKFRAARILDCIDLIEACLVSRQIDLRVGTFAATLTGSRMLLERADCSVVAAFLTTTVGAWQPIPGFSHLAQVLTAELIYCSKKPFAWRHVERIVYRFRPCTTWRPHLKEAS